MKKRLLLLGLLITSYSHADYTVDYRISRSQVEQSQMSTATAEPGPGTILITNIENNTDQKIAAGDLDIYFGRVRTQGKPLGEAGFLSQLSNFQLSANITETDSDSIGNLYVNNSSFDSYAFTSDSEMASLGGDIEYITKGFPVILGLGASIGFGEAEQQGSIYREDDTELFAWRAKVGLYYSDNGRVTYGYENSETEYDSDFIGMGMNRDIEATTNTLKVKHVFQLAASQFLSVHGEYNKTSMEADNTKYDIKSTNIGLTYYPMTKLGLGVEWLKDDNESSIFDSPTGYKLNIEYFFNNYVGFSLNYQDESANESGSEIVYSDPFVGNITGPTKHDLDVEQITAAVIIRF